MKLKKNNFNLVEIIIAMGIVVICITTIMGLFSVGMEMSKDAVQSSYTNSIIQQISGLIETYPGAEDNVPNAKPYLSPNDTGFTTADNTTAENAENACTTAIDSSDPFLKYVYWNGSTYGTLKIDYKTTLSSGTTVPDFTCFAKLWYDTPTPARVIATTDNSGAGTASIDTDTLNIELTWPHKMTYGDRVSSGNIITFQKVLQQ